jgi:riboflavin synthase
MFTGIIETLGEVQSTADTGSGKSFWLSSSITGELKVDQSLAHNGVCLTVEEISGSRYKVTAILETLQKTNLGDWQPGTRVNLERCMQMNGRLDGHIVQGHVDSTAVCLERQDRDGSWEFRFRYPTEFAALLIEKGSICVNGISLTAFNVRNDEFTVAIIPYTFEHTNIGSIASGSAVNLEFDVIGKYIARLHSLKQF